MNINSLLQSRLNAFPQPQILADFKVIYLGHIESRGNSVLQSTMNIFKLVTKKWKGHELAIAKNSDMNWQELKDLKENVETTV